MGDVIYLRDFKYTWKQIYAFDGEGGSIEIHADSATGNFEVVQQNDEETLRICLDSVQADDLFEALRKFREKAHKDPPKGA